MTQTAPANAIVTGASSGIGAATARRLAAAGLRVYGTSRQPTGSPDAPDADGIRWLALDVRDEASVASAVDAVQQREGGVEAVVCNAGMGIFGSVEETAIDAARRQFETNYFGVLRTLRAVLPGMRARGRGRVVLVGSLAGRAPIPFQSHYSSSKAAIDALAMSLFNEVGPLGVRVCLVEPGDVATPFNDAMDWSAGAGSAYADRIAACERSIRERLPRAPGPEVVARAIERALRSARPRFRYTVGADSVSAPLGRRLLPDRLFLAMVRRHFGIAG